MKCFECNGCVHYALVKKDNRGNEKDFCLNTDRHCFERFQFFQGTLNKLHELKNDVKADILELKRNQEMISECIGRLSTLTFILELYGEEVVIRTNYQRG